jgi:Glycosyltransferase
MKIVLFVSSMHAGGAERVAATLTAGWARDGHEVVLVPTYTRKGKLFYPLDPAVRLVWLADTMGALAKGPLVPLVKLGALRRLIKHERPDVVVSFLTNVNVMVLMAARGLGVPVIVCERTNPAVSASATPALQRLRRWLYPRADMVTVQADASVPAMAKLVPGIRQLEVIPNPLPPDMPPSRSPGARRAEGSLRLAAMGRLVPSKRYAGLIQVFARLAPRHPDWELVIWGEGPARSELEALVESNGLQERVRLPGRSAQPWNELLAADLFVLTSEVEGFPNALLEAMALGLPCVTVDCPSGPREISRDGEDARLVPLNDEIALENALDQLMSDAVERDLLARRGAQSVRERYGLDQVLARWDSLFQAVRK